MSGNKMPSHHGVEEKKNKNYPNKTLRLLCERASCRNFSDRKIEEEILNFVLEAGVHSPTGGNLQPYSIIKSSCYQSTSEEKIRCESGSA